MQNLLNALMQCVIFKYIPIDELQQLVGECNCRVVEYPSGDILAIEDNHCSSLAIIISGEVEIQKYYSSGKTITLARLKSGNTFGEAILFSTQNKYPATILAVEKCKILYIEKNDVINILIKHNIALENFMSLLSNRILMLNKKIRDLSLETIRQKICSFLLEEYKKQSTLYIKLPFSRKSMADYLGIQRPSLSRELIKMKEDAWIDFDRNMVKIIDIQKLEVCLDS